MFRRLMRARVGSLWTAQSPWRLLFRLQGAPLNDTITIQVAVQTTAAQSGTVNSRTKLYHNSAITGIMGRVPPRPILLLSGNSSSVLKGQGSTASNTLFSTNLTGQVIAVLPNGNLVVEAGARFS
jgi:flagellar L-ring protein precursor FlgH